MQDLNDRSYFDRVVEHGGYAAAWLAIGASTNVSRVKAKAKP